MKARDNICFAVQTLRIKKIAGSNIEKNVFIRIKH